MSYMSEIKRGDIFYADLGERFGCEQGGIRPVLITQNNTGNYFSPTVHVAPLTSRKGKSKLPTHVFIPWWAADLPTDSIVLVEQSTTIDKQRLGRYIGHLHEKFIPEIDRAICVSFAVGTAA